MGWIWGWCTGLGILGAAAVVIAAHPGGAEAAFPPGDNGKIAFWRFPVGPAPADVWTMNASGSGQVNLTDGAPQGQGDPHFSPNGRKIAYGRATGGQTDIWTMNSNGGDRHNLTKTPGFDESEPTFTPDGETIVYLRLAGQMTTVTDVWLMKADGSRQRKLLTSFGAPDISPDGRRIAYSAGGDIWTANLNGSGKRRLTNTDPLEIIEQQPAYSPDGRRITYRRENDIGIMSVNGSGERNLTPIPGFPLDSAPVFSPDGRWIAFQRDDFVDDVSVDLQRDILVIRPAGSGLRNLTKTDNRDESEPDWQSIHRCGGRRVTITGDDGPDTIKGTGKADVIMGFGGSDTINGRGGKDIICGGDGRDRLRGGGGRDRLIGGAGKDTTKQ